MTQLNPEVVDQAGARDVFFKAFAAEASRD